MLRLFLYLVATESGQPYLTQEPKVARKIMRRSDHARLAVVRPMGSWWCCGPWYHWVCTGLASGGWLVVAIGSGWSMVGSGVRLEWCRRLGAPRRICRPVGDFRPAGACRVASNCTPAYAWGWSLMQHYATFSLLKHNLKYY